MPEINQHTLSREHEHNLFKSLSDNGCRLCRDTLIEANLGNVINISRTLKKQYPKSDFNELRSEGTIFMIQLLYKFDYTKSFRFYTYLKKALTRHLLDYILKDNTIYLPKAKALEGGLQTVNITDYNHPGEHTFHSTHISSALTYSLSILDEVEYDIITSCFGFFDKPETLKEISSRMDIPYSTITKKKHKALIKLKAVF